MTEGRAGSRRVWWVRWTVWRSTARSFRRARKVGVVLAAANLVATPFFPDGNGRALAFVPVTLLAPAGLRALVLLAGVHGPLRPPPRVLNDVMHGLVTERLRLRRFRPRDTLVFHDLYDEEHRRANGLLPDFAEQNVRAAATWAVPRLASWVAITDRRTGAVVGDVGLHHHDIKARTCDLGWSLGPGARGRGYGTELLATLLPALHAAGVRQVRIGTAPDNVGVQKVMARLGLPALPSTPHTLPDGTEIDSLWWVSVAPGEPLPGHDPAAVPPPG